MIIHCQVPSYFGVFNYFKLITFRAFRHLLTKKLNLLQVMYIYIMYEIRWNKMIFKNFVKIDSYSLFITNLLFRCFPPNYFDFFSLPLIELNAIWRNSTSKKLSIISWQWKKLYHWFEIAWDAGFSLLQS